LFPACVTGRPVRRPHGVQYQSGATHVLKDARGHDQLLLRGPGGLLEGVEGKTIRLCGFRRGRIRGEPLALFEVTGGILLDQLPLRPGLDPYPGPAEVNGGGLPVRPLVGL
jgi:hypothetical protein